MSIAVTVRRLLYLLLSAVVLGQVFALPAQAETTANPRQSWVSLSRDNLQVDVSRNLTYLEDAAGTLTADEAYRKMEAGEFQGGQQGTLNFGFTRSVYWFHLHLDNRDSFQDEWVLEVQYPIIDQIESWYFWPDGHQEHHRAGDSIPFHERSRDSHFTNFSVNLPPTGQVDILLRVETSGAIQMPTVVWDEDAHTTHYHHVQILIGLYYGLIFAMAVYNFLLWISLRDRTYFLCVAYIVGYGLFQLALNGLAFEYLWPDSPWWNNRSIAFLMSTGLFFIIAFSRAFLALERTAPRSVPLFNFLMLFFIVMMIGALFLPYQIVIRTATLGSMFTAVSIFAVGLYCWLRRFKPARYFMMSWAALLGGMLTYTLKTFGVLPATFLTEYAMQIGSAMEMLLLSFALADRIKILTEENARIQRDAKTVLEANVKARTQELEHANRKLAELSATDALTGLKNRRFFDEAFALECKRSTRFLEQLAVLLIDIDHFKMINDTYGHPVGDQVLAQVAQIMRTKVRRDTDTVARYGGEEFVIILPSTDTAGALQVADTILRTVRSQPFVVGELTLPLTVSIGVAALTLPDAQSAQNILEQADVALYQSKQSGRDRCTLYREQVSKQIAR
ncbi:MAG TPA: diguanylate cyclase [Dongiaceae bacterium]|nr:diguanylate cyclase [Dongiaceae bacterium]